MALVWGWAVALVGCWQKEAETMTGDVKVRYTSPVVVGRDTVWGVYMPDKRMIVIDSALPYRTRQHYIEHERCHAILNDEGITLDSLPEEQVCEAWAKWQRRASR